MAMPPFRADERASFVTAVLPMVLATAGFLMLAAGAILNAFPLLLLGGGLGLIAVTFYMLATLMDRGDRRTRRAPPEDRASRARAAYEADRQRLPEAPVRTRSPLADQAVAALTGSAEGGGIYPPLPSQQGGGRAAAPGRSAAPVPVWEPGASPRPDAFGDERVVEFEEVSPEMVHAAVVGGRTEPTHHAPRASRPASMSAPAPDADRDFRIWPGASNVDSWATFTGERKHSKSRVSDEEIRTAMAAKRQEFAGKLPTVGAILAGVDARHDPAVRDMARGKCSQCESVIWAPKQRPILLKCPSCGHKAKLY